MPTINETPLTRAATQMSADIVKPLRSILVGRRFASINPHLKGDGKTSLEVTSVSDLSDASVTYNLPSGDEDSDALVSTSTIVKIPVLFKKFKIERRDILAWENRQVGAGDVNSLNSIAAATASHKVAEQEEEIIFNGWKQNGSTYAIKGFSQVAGNSVVGGSIATPGTLFGYVADLIGKLEEDGVFGESNSWNLALTPSIHAKLIGSRYQNGDREYPAIREILGDGNIYVTPTLSGKGGSNADAAILTPVDTARQHFEFLNPVDYRISLAEPKWADLSAVEGIAYELFAPNFLRMRGNVCNAVGKITGLTV